MAGDHPDVPHPRERHALVGHEAAEGTLRGAIESGRLHHAWLIGGAEGIGKATLAYRTARFLLAPEAERGPSGLAVDPAGRTARQVAARSHPNLLVLERAAGEGDKAAPRTISVESVRRVQSFFGTTAADGGHRVCVVDSIDHVTINGLNALLKMVEEPPARSTILLVSHAPRRVLATIRSRCMRLTLPALPETDLAAVVRGLGPDFAELPEAELAAAAAAADGSVSRAVWLLGPKRRALLAEIDGLLHALPDVPALKVLALADKLADRKGEDVFPAALDAVLRWAARRLRDGQAGGPRRLAPLAEVCDKLGREARAVETYNLDRRPFVITLFGELAEAVRLAA